MANTVLVLGGGGFIGASLCQSLSDAGWRVMSGTRRPVDSGNAKVQNVVSSFDEKDHFSELLEQCDLVIHSASNTTPSSSATKPQLDGNLRSTLALIEALQKVHRTRLLYISSGGTLYRESRLALTEDSLLMPRSYHGAGKAAAEHFIQAWALQGAASAIILRPSNIYGPGQYPKNGFGIVPAAMRGMIEESSLHIWGDGSAVRDYLYIDDFLALCHAAISSFPKKGLRTMNASSGVGVCLNDLLSMIESVAGKIVRRKYLPARPIDMHHVVLDSSLARFELGWSPKVGLETGLVNTWRWFESSCA